MSFTFCTSGAIVVKAGANVNTTASASNAILTQFCDEAESYINNVTRIDYITKFSGLSANKKYILQEVASDIAATYLVNYDMSGYTTRGEAQTMLNVLWGRAEKGLKLLEAKDTTTFLG